MKYYLPKFILTIFICTTTLAIADGQLYEWRGPDRTGIYNETGLLKKWPDGGPKLLWEATGMGDGYSSPTVTDDAVYVTGRKDSSDVLTALTLDGKIEMGNSIWQSLDDKPYRIEMYSNIL